MEARLLEIAKKLEGEDRATIEQAAALIQQMRTSLATRYAH
jgi:hypothetical protein